jgi:hypothetical protein
MLVLSPILAQPLTPDYIWFALLLLAVLAWMHRLDALGNRVAEDRKTGHRLHELSRRPHEPGLHGPH